MGRLENFLSIKALIIKFVFCSIAFATRCSTNPVCYEIPKPPVRKKFTPYYFFPGHLLLYPAGYCAKLLPRRSRQQQSGHLAQCTQQQLYNKEWVQPGQRVVRSQR